MKQTPVSKIQQVNMTTEYAVIDSMTNNYLGETQSLQAKGKSRSQL